MNTPGLYPFNVELSDEEREELERARADMQNDIDRDDSVIEKEKI